MAQRWTVFDRGRSTQRLSHHRSQRAHAGDRRPQRSPEPARSDHLAFVLGLVVGRLWTYLGHSGYGDAQGDLRSRARFAALGPLAGCLGHSLAKAATISAISQSCWKRRIAAIPPAPALRHAVAFSTVIPPIAMTGMDTALQTCPNFAKPCGGPELTFDGVSKTGPKKR